MTDYFVLLEELRRPWLDVEILKSRFLAKSGEVHPDRFHQAEAAERNAATQRYAELNAAYNCLREPRDRLQHLLLLECGAKPASVDSVANESMELFMKAGTVFREIDALLVERSKVTSPMLKVQLLARGMEWTDRLNDFQRELNSRRERVDEHLRQMNAQWESAPPVGSSDRAAVLPLVELELAYRTLSYLSRWSVQLQERVVQLAL